MAYPGKQSPWLARHNRGTIGRPATAVPLRAKKTRQVFDYAGRSLLLSQVFRGRFLQ
jgi:hypothetical protein